MVKPRTVYLMGKGRSGDHYRFQIAIWSWGGITCELSQWCEGIQGSKWVHLCRFDSSLGDIRSFEKFLIELLEEVDPPFLQGFMPREVNQRV